MRFTIQLVAAVAVLSSAAFQAVKATPIGAFTSVVNLDARDAVEDCRRTCGMRHDHGSPDFMDCLERCHEMNFPGRNAAKSHAAPKSHKKRDIEQVLDARDAVEDCRRTCGMRHDHGSPDFMDCLERCHEMNFPGRNAAKSHAAPKSHKKRDVETVIVARDAVEDCRRTCGMRHDHGSPDFMDCLERCHEMNFPGRNAAKSHAAPKSHKKREVELVLDARDAVEDCRRTCGMRHDHGSPDFMDCLERCHEMNFPGRNAAKSHAAPKSHKKREIEIILAARDAVADCRRTCGMRHDHGSPDFMDCLERCHEMNFPGRNAAKSHKKRAL
ncbi:hypothetical protein B0H34DRAFT_861308 [Crassisporium funariophilum]|nr:hypothetical protein B0H34DRAFT_861308 [Crassisporium funariophilum]